MNTPLVSIIIPTLGRCTEVEALLASIAASNYTAYEVLIIDQNGSDLVDEVVARYAPQMHIHHLKVCLRGVSRARNYGVRFANGEILCFPDDDAELFPDTIARALATMSEKNAPVVFGRAIDHHGSDAVLLFEEHAAYLTAAKHEGMFLEFTIFIQKPLWERFPNDENLGVGTFHGAEECHDLVLRLLDENITMFYDPQILFYHPIKVTTHRSSEEIRRVFTYRCGFSRLCLKHKLYTRLGSRMLKVALYLIYLTFFNRRKARYYLAELLGLLSGAVVK